MKNEAYDLVERRVSYVPCALLKREVILPVECGMIKVKGVYISFRFERWDRTINPDPDLRDWRYRYYDDDSVFLDIEELTESIIETIEEIKDDIFWGEDLTEWRRVFVVDFEDNEDVAGCLDDEIDIQYSIAPELLSYDSIVTRERIHKSELSRITPLDVKWKEGVPYLSDICVRMIRKCVERNLYTILKDEIDCDHIFSCISVKNFGLIWILNRFIREEVSYPIRSGIIEIIGIRFRFVTLGVKRAWFLCEGGDEYLIDSTIPSDYDFPMQYDLDHCGSMDRDGIDELLQILDSLDFVSDTSTFYPQGSYKGLLLVDWSVPNTDEVDIEVLRRHAERRGLSAYWKSTESSKWDKRGCVKKKESVAPKVAHKKADSIALKKVKRKENKTMKSKSSATHKAHKKYKHPYILFDESKRLEFEALYRENAKKNEKKVRGAEKSGMK